MGFFASVVARLVIFSSINIGDSSRVSSEHSSVSESISTANPLVSEYLNTANPLVSAIRAVSPAVDQASSSTASTWCVALSGNGGNWASTLGFISEALLLYVEEQSPQKINLRCAVGGSSGAATTVLLRSLLANPSFGVSSDGVATRAQAVSIARALSLLAQTTDLNSWEKAQTVAAVAKTKLSRWGEEAWDKNTVAIDVASILLQFGRTIALARHMHSAWSELTVADMIQDQCGLTDWGQNWCKRETLVEVAKDFGLQYAADLPKRLNNSAVQEKRRIFAGAETKSQLAFIMKDISSHMLNFTYKKLKAKGFSSGQANGLKVRSGSGNMVDDVLAETPEDGFMTVTFVHRRDDPEESVEGVAYADTRVLALMSRGTAESILQSQLYRRRISACQQKDAAGCQHADRFILAAVETMRPMIALPTMEPGIVKPLVASLSSMGITNVFDPTIVSLQGSWSLQSTQWNNFEVDPTERWEAAILGGENYVILGGFVDRGQSVALQQFYADGRKLEDVQFGLFGKNTDPKTAINAVVDLLSDKSDESSGEVNWADYKAWAEARPSGTFIDGLIDWDCGAGLPANIRGASWELRLHGASRARASACSMQHAACIKQHDIFDPMEGCEERDLS